MRKHWFVLAPVSALLLTVPALAEERLGVAIVDVNTGKAFYQNRQTAFPMQSVFKAPLSVAVLQAVDAGKLKLDQKVVVKRSDLSMLHSPLRDKFHGASEEHTVRELVELAVQESDNTAADLLMKIIGGPKVVTAMLRNAGITGMRVDRYEREIQPELQGLPGFKDGDSIDQAAYAKRAAAVAPAVKKKALESSLSDERDSCTPESAATFLSMLYKGKLLSADSTRLMLDIMSHVNTGKNRLIAGIPKGSSLAHKTGTGPTILGVNVATNDIGLVTMPDGRVIAVAALLSGSKRSEVQRDKLIRDVAVRATK